MSVYFCFCFSQIVSLSVLTLHPSASFSLSGILSVTVHTLLAFSHIGFRPPGLSERTPENATISLPGLGSWPFANITLVSFRSLGAPDWFLSVSRLLRFPLSSLVSTFRVNCWIDQSVCLGTLFKHVAICRSLFFLSSSLSLLSSLLFDSLLPLLMYQFLSSVSCLVPLSVSVHSLLYHDLFLMPQVFYFHLKFLSIIHIRISISLCCPWLSLLSHCPLSSSLYFLAVTSSLYACSNTIIWLLWAEFFPHACSSFRM